MIVRYDDAASDFEKAELRFQCRHIFASGQVGTIKEVTVWVDNAFDRRGLPANSRSSDDRDGQTEWLIEIPARRFGEFVCSHSSIREENNDIPVSRKIGPLFGMHTAPWRAEAS